MGLGFLNPLRVFRALQLRSAEARHRASPGAEETLHLARLLVHLGKGRSALDCLWPARERFPENEEIRDLLTEVQAALSEEEIRVLERSVKRRPNSRDLARLVELLRCILDFDRCLEVARKARERFPGSWMVELAVGKAHLHRFLTGRSPEDAREAVRRLREAQALNPRSPRPIFYRAALHLQAGAGVEAREALKELQDRARNDPHAQDLLTRLRGGGRAPPTRAQARPRRAPPARPAGTRDGFQDLLGALRETPEVCAAFILDTRGKMVHEHRPDSDHFKLDGPEPAALLTQAARSSAEKIGIGRLESCVVEGPSWWIYCAGMTGHWLVIFTQHGLAPAALEELLRQHSPEPVAL